MPTKFPIDYEPGKVQAFLISKETGQMIEATPLTEIVPKPWPIDDIEIETEPEPPKVFTNTVTFKMSKKDTKSFRRLIRKSIKLPRKLKKAFRHIGLFEDPMAFYQDENGITCRQAFWFGPKNGYPKTKWIKKALKICNQRLVKQ